MTTVPNPTSTASSNDSGTGHSFYLRDIYWIADWLRVRERDRLPFPRWQSLPQRYWHDRGVDDAQAINTDHTQFIINDGPSILFRTHPAGADQMIPGIAALPCEFESFVVGADVAPGKSFAIKVWF